MGEMIVSAGAIVGGLTIIASVAWKWVIGPAFTRSVSDIVEARNAQQLKPIMGELSMNGGKSLKDRVIRIDERLDAHITFHRQDG